MLRSKPPHDHDLLQARTTHISAARALIDTCKAASRDLSPAEQTTVKNHLHAVETLDTWERHGRET